MEILTSNFEPLALTSNTFVARWQELFHRSEALTIGIGYASNESLLYLKKLVELNQPKQLDLCLGMAYFDGLSKSQFEAAQELDRFLVAEEVGKIKVSRAFPFHGKIQAFSSSEYSDTCLVGSSNLTNIVPISGILRRNYEVDIEIADPSCNLEIRKLLSQLFNDASEDFGAVADQITVKQDSHSLLATRSDVATIGAEKLRQIQASVLSSCFEIPLKDKAKSNLNSYFGKGRMNQQGFVSPRPWYEAEIVVGVAIQRSSGNYPANKDFVVYTDDCYRFLMRTSGPNGKNLRSRDDLTILGRWIKGRLEASGALRSGHPVTRAVLETYGRHTITLAQTSLREVDTRTGDNLEVWYASFGLEAGAGGSYAAP